MTNSTPTGARAPMLPRLPIPGDDAILVVPLGGTDRVGMNATLVGYAGRWILIDAGATFPGSDDEDLDRIADEIGGEVNQIIPDLRAVADILPRLDAIVLTHAHEDHIGALAGIFGFSEAWPRMRNVPIYGTAYTLATVRAKLEEVNARPPLRNLSYRIPVRIGGVDVMAVEVTHSCPQTSGLLLRTAAGSIFFGSDMKLDAEPLLGRTTDTQALEAIGAMGLTAFFGDSTNAVHEGRSISEGECMRGLESVMNAHSGRVVVATFASNVARICGVAAAARSSGRNLAGAGRSILRNVDSALDTNLISKREVNLLAPQYVGRLPTRNAALICTGSQGEPGSALRRMADDFDLGRPSRGFTLEAGDVLVHSARSIPGNELSINAMLDTFRNNGVKVITADDPGPKIHASGHARRDELRDFYRMLKPLYAAPVHGHAELIAGHVDLARSMSGVRQAVSPREGDVMRVSQGGLSILGRIKVDQLASVTIGGRNGGESRLVGWAGSTRPDLSLDHGAARRAQGRNGRSGNRRQESRERVAPAPAFA